MKTRIYAAPAVKGLKNANHDYSHLNPLYLAGQITVIGNKMIV